MKKSISIAKDTIVIVAAIQAGAGLVLLGKDAVTAVVRKIQK